MTGEPVARDLDLALTLAARADAITLARFGALDLRVLGNIVVSWIVTLPAGGIMAALFFFVLKGIFG